MPPVVMTGEEWEELLRTLGAPVSEGALRTDDGVQMNAFRENEKKTTDISFIAALSCDSTGLPNTF